MKSIFFKKNCLLLLILFFAILLRFVGLSWGLPYSFHPDEWNMATSISQLSWQEKLNPRFFAYGQFPLYLTYFSSKLYNLLSGINLKEITVSEATFFLRFWSATAGAFGIYFVYLISKRFLTTNYALMSTLLATLTPGLIQNSHFGTTESILTLGFLGTVYFSLLILEKPRFKYYLLSAIFLAIALGAKITAAVFLVPLTLVSFFHLFTSKRGKIFLSFLSSLIIALTLALTLSPYIILNFDETKRIISYETQIAAGKIPVFYTRQFVNTTPILFQFRKIFPFTFGWPIFIIGTLGFVFSAILLIKSAKNKEISQITNYQLLVTVISFLIYFFSQAFLFTKWIRFMSPIFPFFAIFAAFMFSKLNSWAKIPKILNSIFIILAIIPGLMFFTIYLKPDIRFAASKWIYENIPPESKIFSETGNVIDIPVSPPNHQILSNNYSISSFDFYQLDRKPELFLELLTLLESSDYIFIPSRRIFTNHMRLPQEYPLTSKYYELLFSEKLGFILIKEFSPFNHGLFNDELAEETWTVFDHPTIRIYKKDKKLSLKEYEKLFNN